MSDKTLKPNQSWFRRLPLRYSLRTLLMVPVAWAVGWWWFIWPARTAREFAAMVAERRFEEANPMMKNGRWSTPAKDQLILVHLRSQQELCGISSIDWQAWSQATGSGVCLMSREVDEVLRNERRFMVGEFPLQFTAKRGTVFVPDALALCYQPGVSTKIIGMKGDVFVGGVRFR